MILTGKFAVRRQFGSAYAIVAFKFGLEFVRPFRLARCNLNHGDLPPGSSESRREVGELPFGSPYSAYGPHVDLPTDLGPLSSRCLADHQNRG